MYIKKTKDKTTSRLGGSKYYVYIIYIFVVVFFVCLFVEGDATFIFSLALTQTNTKIIVFISYSDSRSCPASRILFRIPVPFD